MLIINADDYGRDRHTTDAILDAFQMKAITDTTAMSFMEDAERAANLAKKRGFPVGLHINFTEPFSAENTPLPLQKAQEALVHWFRKRPMTTVFFNPLLAEAITMSFQAQEAQFIRLYGKTPTHYDGHHHIHLCWNFLLSGQLKRGVWVRPNFSFAKGEKPLANRAYRKVIDALLRLRYRTVERFYALDKDGGVERLQAMAIEAKEKHIEIMCHPAVSRDMKFLEKPEIRDTIRNAPLTSYLRLKEAK